MKKKEKGEAMKHIRFLAEVFNQPQAILPEKAVIIADALLHGNFDEKAFNRHAEDESRLFRAQDGVGILDFHGTLVHRALGMQAASGLVSYQKIGSILEAAVEDSSLDYIVLNIDSPGGESKGLFALVDKIYAMKKRKRIVCLGNELLCSAAYAIGSACSELYITEFARTGSIGTVMMHMETSKRDEKEGYTFTVFRSGSLKALGTMHEALSEAAQEQFQTTVNAHAKFFAEKVVRGRPNLSVGELLSLQGGTMIGSEAVDFGLVDGIRTLDELLKQPQEEQTMKEGMNGAQSANEQDLQNLHAEIVMKNADLDKRNAAITEQLEKLNAAEARLAEREEKLLAQQQQFMDEQFKTKFEAKFGNIPGIDQDKLQAGLLELRKSSPALASTFEGLFSQISSTFEQDMKMTSVEGDATQASDMSVEDMIEATAKKYQEEHMGASRAESLQFAMRKHQDAYNNSARSRRAKVRSIAVN